MDSRLLVLSRRTRHGSPTAATVAVRCTVTTPAVACTTCVTVVPRLRGLHLTLPGHAAFPTFPRCSHGRLRCCVWTYRFRLRTHTRAYAFGCYLCHTPFSRGSVSPYTTLHTGFMHTTLPAGLPGSCLPTTTPHSGLPHLYYRCRLPLPLRTRSPHHHTHTCCFARTLHRTTFTTYAATLRTLPVTHILLRCSSTHVHTATHHW